jgi:hypothetical protein
MNRLGLLSRLQCNSPRKAIASAGVLLVAAAVAVGSQASFNSASSNPANVITAGIVKLSNSRANSAILTVSALKPGATATGTVNIGNAGDINAALTLAEANLVDTPASPALSAKLTLLVQDLGSTSCTSNCPAPVTLYSGALGSMPTLSLGTYTPSLTHQFRFTVTFPDSGTPSGDNAYQSANTKVDLNWTANQA